MSTITGSAGNDTITGTAAADEIYGGDGNDSLDCPRIYLSLNYVKKSAEG